MDDDFQKDLFISWRVRELDWGLGILKIRMSFALHANARLRGDGRWGGNKKL